VGFCTVMLALPTAAIRLAGTDAVNGMPTLTNVVVSGVPFQSTVAPLTKFEPFTVSVKPIPPAVIEIGLRLVIEGAEGALMGNVAGADGLPPEFVTVMLALPMVAIKLAVTAAVSCVELTNVVVSPAPFQFTTAPLMKFVPFTVRGESEPPAVAEVGVMLLIVGVGTVMLKPNDDDALPPAFATVILALPELAISPAGTAAVN